MPDLSLRGKRKQILLPEIMRPKLNRCWFRTDVRKLVYDSSGLHRIVSDLHRGSPVLMARIYVRTARTPDYCPTDEQAEILIPDMIALEDILGLAVHSVEQARNEIVRLLYLQVPEARVRGLKIVIAPDLYDKHKLSRMLKLGQRPEEKPFDSRTVK